MGAFDDRERARAAEEEEERKKWKRRDPRQEREERIQFLSELSRYIDERIPLDPRFIVIRTHKTREMNQIEHHSQRIGLEGGGFIQQSNIIVA